MEFTECEAGCGTTFESQPGKRFCSRDCQLKGRSTENLALSTIARLLAENGVDPQEVKNVQRIKFSQWDGYSRDEDGVSTPQSMQAVSLVLSPSWAEGPQWPVVQQAAPVVIKPAKRARVMRTGTWLTGLIMPDIQVGFRRDVATGELDPFHDLRAIDVALQILAVLDPDLVVYLGDCLDLAPFGKYVQEPMFALTVQPALDYLHSHLATVRATVPEADIRYIEGNHDLRLQTSTIVNAAASFGIRLANVPDSWPVLSVPHLLRLDELDVEYVSGYPAGATYINDNLACVHGSRVKSNGSTAAMIVNDEQVSTIFGHVHRVETVYKTRNNRGEPMFNMAHTPGCLCRIDGAVPGVKSGIDPFGHPIKHFENWQQSVTVVHYEEGDGRFNIESIPIFEGFALWRGQEFHSRVDLRGEPVAA